MNIEAVGFDLDHTLLVPDRDRAVILRDATERVNAPPIDRDEYLDAHNTFLTRETREPIFKELLEPKDTTVSPRELTETYRSLINESLTLIPNCLALLETIREDYLTGLVTNGPSRAQREKITRFNLESYFDAIIISGEIHVGKPDFGAFNALTDKLDVAPADSIFVGDNVTEDIEGGINAGFSAIQVCYPTGPKPDDRALARINRGNLSDELPHILARLTNER